MDGMAHVHVVRHGATIMNNDTDMSQDRIRGHRDVPLAPKGREEAMRAAEHLRGAGIQVIVCSDLSRARETALIISHELGGIPVQVNPNLRPWDLGNFTGQTTKEALPQIIAYVRERPDDPVPGGESLHQFVAHANKGLLEAIQVANGRRLVVVTHHRDERLWKSEQAAGWTPGQLDLEVFAQKGDPPGGVFEMDVPVQALSAMVGTAGGAQQSPNGQPGQPPMPMGQPQMPPQPGGAPPAPPGMPPAQPAVPPQPNPMAAMFATMGKITKAIDLLRQDIPRGYRIDIEIDTMVAGDQQQERADATEFLTATTKFIETAGQIVLANPEFAPLAAKMLQFGVRRFRTGRDLESAIDEYADRISKKMAAQPPNKGPTPEQSKAQAEQARANAEIAKAKIDAQSAQANDQREQQLRQQEFAFKQRQHEMEMQMLQMKMQHETQIQAMKMQLEQRKTDAEMTRATLQEQAAQADHRRNQEAAEDDHRRAKEAAEFKHRQAMQPKEAAA